MRLRDSNKEESVKKTALDLLVQSGLEGFSMNKLARACRISVATLYIYYRDKDDLILKLVEEEGQRIAKETLSDFNPNMPFEEGLRKQWTNRARSMLTNPNSYRLFELLRASTYQQKWNNELIEYFRPVLGPFIENAIHRNEVNAMPFEVFWSLAYAPLYNLIGYHFEGITVDGKPFTLNDETIWETFAYVVKGLKK